MSVRIQLIVLGPIHDASRHHGNWPNIRGFRDPTSSESWSSRLRRPHPLSAEDRGAIAPGGRTREGVFAQRQRAGVRVEGAVVLDRHLRHRPGVDRAGATWLNGSSSHGGVTTTRCIQASTISCRTGSWLGTQRPVMQRSGRYGAWASAPVLAPLAPQRADAGIPGCRLKVTVVRRIRTGQSLQARP